MPQPTDHIADALERESGELDALIARRRLGPRTAASLHELDEDVQALAARLSASTRKPTSKAPPLKVTRDGAWF